MRVIFRSTLSQTEAHSECLQRCAKNTARAENGRKKRNEGALAYGNSTKRPPQACNSDSRVQLVKVISLQTLSFVLLSKNIIDMAMGSYPRPREQFTSMQVSQIDF